MTNILETHIYQNMSDAKKKVRIQYGELKHTLTLLQVLHYLNLSLFNCAYRPPTADDLLLSCLSKADLVAYSHTCKQLYKTASSFNRRAYHIDFILSII